MTETEPKSLAPATIGDIAYYVVAHHTRLVGPDNWGLGKSTDIPGTQTYVNGIPLNIDLDYEWACLAECVDRETSQVTYVAVSTVDKMQWVLHPEPAGTFFERKVTLLDAIAWAGPTLVDMIESLAEARAVDASRLEREEGNQ